MLSRRNLSAHISNTFYIFLKLCINQHQLIDVKLVLVLATKDADNKYNKSIDSDRKSAVDLILSSSPEPPSLLPFENVVNNSSKMASIKNKLYNDKRINVKIEQKQEIATLNLNGSLLTGDNAIISRTASKNQSEDTTKSVLRELVNDNFGLRLNEHKRKLDSTIINKGGQQYAARSSLAPLAAAKTLYMPSILSPTAIYETIAPSNNVMNHHDKRAIQNDANLQNGVNIQSLLINRDQLLSRDNKVNSVFATKLDGSHENNLNHSGLTLRQISRALSSEELEHFGPLTSLQVWLNLDEEEKKLLMKFMHFGR